MALPLKRGTLKTYSHLAGGKRLPSPYEIVTSDLLYYPRKGFEVQTPVARWIERHQKQGTLRLEGLEDFRDPQETTYSAYTERQREKEIYLQGLFDQMEEAAYLGKPDNGWIDTLDDRLAPLVYPLHGLQMAAAYVAHLAPSSRVVIPAMFQSADELKRIQKVAYHTALLRRKFPDYGTRRKEKWQESPLWQPVRKLTERLLIAYDWGEAFVALNLCVKPVGDEIFLHALSEAADRHGDDLLGYILKSLREDGQWHREWSLEVLKLLLDRDSRNRTAIRRFFAQWSRISLEAADGFVRSARGFGESDRPPLKRVLEPADSLIQS